MKSPYKILLYCLYFNVISCSSHDYRVEDIKAVDETTEDKIIETYNEADLQQHFPFALFRIAMIGFYNIKDLKISDRITIIDYSKPSTEERFYVVDLDKKELLYKCLVAHGINTGNNLASNFSNELNSKKSSLGLFITAETYQGKHGYSLKLDGIEKDINNNARKRAIVIHGADYVSKEFIKKHGRLGRSWGCPALPEVLSQEIIESISGGRCLFIYGNDDEYLNRSEYILKKENKS